MCWLSDAALSRDWAVTAAGGTTRRGCGRLLGGGSMWR